MLYLIRLLIFGVGVAAIAGTLLSVLSPSNLADSSGPEESARDEALGTASGPLVAGTTANLVNDVALAQDMTRLQAEIEQLGALTPGLTQSVFMVDLDTGDYVDVAGSQAMAAASTIKVPILVAFFQEVDAGVTSPSTRAWSCRKRRWPGALGTMQNEPVGTRYTALEVASQMIVTSDNTATNMMIDALGGMEALNQRFQAWGLEATVLRQSSPRFRRHQYYQHPRPGVIDGPGRPGGAAVFPVSRSHVQHHAAHGQSLAHSLWHYPMILYWPIKPVIWTKSWGMLPWWMSRTAGGTFVSVLVERPDNDGRASELIRRTAETGHAEIQSTHCSGGRCRPQYTGSKRTGSRTELKMEALPPYPVAGC